MLSRAVLDVHERLGIRTLHRDDDEGGAVALDSPPAGAGTGGGGGAPSPTFNHSGSTVTVNADNAIDFSNNITAQIGTPHTEIELEPDIQWDVNRGVKKITSVGLTVTTKIVKVRFGMGRPNEKHKKAIDEMVAAIKTHEEAHRAIIVAAATAGLAKAQTFVGTSKIKEAWKALDTGVTCVAAKKHEDLDAKEGLLTASEDGNGNVTVSKSASGAKYPCPPAKVMPTG
jgi:predicted secreted Zn-dependent protease